MNGQEHISTTDTAKMLRKMLKAAFPETKFSVRSSSYSGGSSIRIEWLDGPTGRAVSALANPLEGASFDGMQDLKTYNSPLLVAGVRVSFGADFIFAERKHSRELLEFAREKVCGWWGCQPCEIDESPYNPSCGRTMTDGERNVGGGHFSTSDLVYQLAAVTSATGGVFVFDATDTPSPREVTDEIPEERAKVIRDEAFRTLFPVTEEAVAASPVVEKEAKTVNCIAGADIAPPPSEAPIPDNVVAFPPRVFTEPVTRQTPVAARIGHVVDSLLLLRAISDRVAQLDEPEVARALECAFRGLAISIPARST